MENIFHIAKLTLKKWFGSQKETESDTLNAHKELSNSISQKEIAVNLERYDTIDIDAEWNDFEKLLATEKKPSKTKVISIAPYLKYAAVFIGLFMGTYFFINQPSTTKNAPIIALNLPSTPQIQLPNGSIIHLDSSKKITIKNNNQIIATANNTQINYTHSSKNTKAITHKLSVPFGKNFKINLADGTKIYCDAGSIITYPTHFSAKENRKVTLVGQAYFDVSKNKKHPFIVNTNDLQIEVLGTQFNVNAYAENLTTSTVLVEGSVAVTPTKTPNTKKQFLVPGQRAAIQARSKKIKITNGNTYKATSWMSNKLVFKKTPFNTILQTLSRKYNIEIINNNEYLSKQLFTAKFDTETLEQILEVFKFDTPFTYTKTENTLIINN